MKKVQQFFKSKYFISSFAGALCALAFAPFYLIIFAPISLSVFYFLLEKEKNNKPIFFLGFTYGFGYFLAGNYWIAISLLVDAHSFAWLIPFALTLIPSALALYLALLALSYKKIISRFHFHKNYQKILIFAILWIIFEALRSYLFTGFPWNLLGYIWMIDEVLAQSANVFGIYGLSFLAVLISLLPILFLKNNNKKDDKIFAAIITLLFIANLTYGKIYIDDDKLVINEESKIRLVQANIKQEMKWDEREKYKNFLKTINLTNYASLDGIKMVIWSETSLPYAIDNNPQLFEKLKLATPTNGFLISGALRINVENNQLKNVWNSVFIFNENGVVDFYDKHHLVPFGEYVPLQKFLPFIEKITQGGVGFSNGKGVKTIVANNLKFSPLICYEAIFFNEIIDKNNRPNLLVNVTNDAWFGFSTGPFQHFDMARMRAIEHGISLARVANTGISAMVDPFGRVVKKINLNDEGAIDVASIEALPPTIYEKYDQLPLILLALLTLIFLFFDVKYFSKNH